MGAKTKNISSLIAVVTVMSLIAQTAIAKPAKEQMVKAAILYNLARFSSWPILDEQKADGKFCICILNGDYMATPLKTLVGNEVQNLKIEVVELSDLTFVSPACHLFFLSEEHSQHQDLSIFFENGVLTVGESKEFLKQGGAISIRRYGSKLGFSINRSAMEKVGVIPSSKILNLSARGQ